MLNRYQFYFGRLFDESTEIEVEPDPPLAEKMRVIEEKLGISVQIDQIVQSFSFNEIRLPPEDEPIDDVEKFCRWSFVRHGPGFSIEWNYHTAVNHFCIDLLRESFDGITYNDEVPVIRENQIDRIDTVVSQTGSPVIFIEFKSPGEETNDEPRSETPISKTAQHLTQLLQYLLEVLNDREKFPNLRQKVWFQTLTLLPFHRVPLTTSTSPFALAHLPASPCRDGRRDEGAVD